MNKTFPKSVLKVMDIQTQRQAKEQKRYELRMVIKAFDEYRLGCAYCPETHIVVGKITTLLNQLKESHSLKNWGR